MVTLNIERINAQSPYRLMPNHPRFAAIAQQFSDTIELFREKP